LAITPPITTTTSNSRRLNPARALRRRGDRTGGRTGKNEAFKEGYRLEDGAVISEGTTYH